MNFTNFDKRKAAEVAYFFLWKATKERSMSVTKLRMTKWLYLSERESYKQLGEPIFNDKLFSMKHGPAPSYSLALLEKKKGADDPNWSATIKTTKEKNHQYISIAVDCKYQSIDDLRQLSDAEIQVLETVWTEYGQLSATALEKLLHDQTRHPEWVYPQTNRSTEIDMPTLFASLGYSAEASRELIARHKESDSLDELLNRPA